MALVGARCAPSAWACPVMCYASGGLGVESVPTNHLPSCACIDTPSTWDSTGTHTCVDTGPSCTHSGSWTSVRMWCVPPPTPPRRHVALLLQHVLRRQPALGQRVRRAAGGAVEVVGWLKWLAVGCLVGRLRDRLAGVCWRGQSMMGTSARQSSCGVPVTQHVQSHMLLVVPKGRWFNQGFMLVNRAWSSTRARSSRPLASSPGPRVQCQRSTSLRSRSARVT